MIEKNGIKIIAWDCPNCGERMSAEQMEYIRFDLGCIRCKTSFALFRCIKEPTEYADYPDHLVKVAERNGFIFEQKNKQWLSYSGLLIARSADELERYLIRCGYLTIRE